MKKLPIGLQTFRKLIEQDYVYVDKTKHIHHLITKGEVYFLSRPRRFGKSLLISTLAEIFAGNKNLFKNLAIDSLSFDWQKHPIIYINFSTFRYKTTQELNADITWRLYTIADEYDIDLTGAPSLNTKFEKLLTDLAKINSVVILIDEYDYAIINTIHKPDIAEENRELLREFFTVLKGADQYLRFIFITGVSKFSQTSIFSGLNNLKDLTLSHAAATLLGYTYDEIITYFPEHLTNTAHELDISHEQLLNQMKEWYNGYNFESVKSNIPTNSVYNPFSVLCFFDESKFSNYWFATGTPTFLVNLLKNKNYPIQDFENSRASERNLGNFDIQTLPLQTILFQTGYLTIKSYDPGSQVYTLTYPNKEVHDAFLHYLLEDLIHIREVTFSNYSTRLRNAQ